MGAVSNDQTGGDGLTAGQANYWLGATSGILAGSNGIGGITSHLNSLQRISNTLNLGLDYSSQLKLTTNIGTGLKWVGRGTAAFSIGYSYFQFKSGEISGAKFGMDAAITGASFFPLLGQYIGFQYFIIDGTIGAENFGNMMIQQESQKADMFNNGNWGMGFYPHVGQGVR